MTEETRDIVDEWPLPGGDRVIIVRATTHWPDAEPHYTRRFWYSVVAANGKHVGTPGETFTRKRSAVRAAERHHPRPSEPEAER